MNKKLNTKIVLNKRTIANLDFSEMGDIHGGLLWTLIACKTKNCPTNGCPPATVGCPPNTNGCPKTSIDIPCNTRTCAGC